VASARAESWGGEVNEFNPTAKQLVQLYTAMPTIWPDFDPQATLEQGPDGVVEISSYCLSFSLGFPPHCVIATDLQIVTQADGWTEFTIPDGFVAIVDAEGDLVALVPDRIALVHPERKLVDLLVAMLSAVANNARPVQRG
jgi:hypothetical protein